LHHRFGQQLQQFCGRRGRGGHAGLSRKRGVDTPTDRKINRVRSSMAWVSGTCAPWFWWFRAAKVCKPATPSPAAGSLTSPVKTPRSPSHCVPSKAQQSARLFAVGCRPSAAAAVDGNKKQSLNARVNQRRSTKCAGYLPWAIKIAKRWPMVASALNAHLGWWLKAYLIIRNLMRRISSSVRPKPIPS
jgi:hypothetical protein